MQITRGSPPRPATLPIGSDAPDPARVRRDGRRAATGYEAASLFTGEGARVLFTPDADVIETRDAYVLAVDVPGVREDDLEISLAGDRITVSGRRDEERHVGHATYLTAERSYGAFHRQFVLPPGVDVDQLRSDLRDGVLTLSLPRRAAAEGKASAPPPPRSEG